MRSRNDPDANADETARTATDRMRNMVFSKVFFSRYAVVTADMYSSMNSTTSAVFSILPWKYRSMQYRSTMNLVPIIQFSIRPHLRRRFWYLALQLISGLPSVSAPAARLSRHCHQASWYCLKPSPAFPRPRIKLIPGSPGSAVPVLSVRKPRPSLSAHRRTISLRRRIPGAVCRPGPSGWRICCRCCRYRSSCRE